MAGKSKNRRNTGLLLAAVLTLLAAYTALCAMVDMEHILPGTTVEGVDIGGMALTEAADILKAHEEEFREAAVLTVSAAGAVYTMEAGKALKFDGDALAEEALGRSRGAFFGRGFFLLEGLSAGHRMGAFSGIEDTKMFHKCLEESGVLEAGSAKIPFYELAGEWLMITKGAAGTAVDEEKLMQKILSVLQKGGRKTIKCPMASVKEVSVDLERIYKEIHTDAVNATIDVGNGCAIVESVTGVDFDVEEARKALNETEAGEAASVPLILTEPEISTRDLQENLFADVLGTYTTAVGGTQGRKANVRLAAEKCDGAVLLPDDEFSFNAAVGEQTAETGFYEANGILNGQIVQVYGGGICQVSTTIFDAALYAGLEITERWNHDLVPRYVPAGMDAAVSWPGYDFRFSNNTIYPVRLEVRYEGGYLTVNVLGTKTDDTVIEIETKELGLINGYREVETYREHYNGDKSQVYIEQAAYSSYLR